ncbi:MAG: hypothetical protein EXR77_09820 [Myxococcales bacterium]|nr:hypothetical protein [Myxococcales bacterium]
MVIFACWGWYCHHWPHLRTANEAMRLYFVQAIFETGRPELDTIVARAGQVPVDRSEYGGHVYMDKAPGASLLVAPLYPVVSALVADSKRAGLWVFGYLATLVSMALPLLIALILLDRSLRAHGIGSGGRRLVSAGLATASPLLVYSTLFFGHALAAACILGAFSLITAAPVAKLPRSHTWWAGLLLGWAGLTDTVVFALAILIAMHSWLRALAWEGAPTRLSHLNFGARLRQTWPVWAGLGLGIAAQLAYNDWVLGSPLRFTYQFKGDRALATIMDTGVMGFRLPQPDALFGLLVGSKRGLLYHAPWLLAGAAGLVWVATRRSLAQTLRIDAAASLVMAVIYTLLVAGFADWPAGDSPCARHLVVVVGLIGWGVAPLWSPPAGEHGPLRPWVTGLLLATLVVGVLLHGPTVATFPYHFTQIERPVLELAVPLMFRTGFSPSVGQWLGLPALASFAVFVSLILAVWTLATGPDDDQEGVPHRSKPVQAGRWVHVAVAAVVVVAWLALLAASVPEKPSRATAVGRYHAWSMLKSGVTGEKAGVRGSMGRRTD